MSDNAITEITRSFVDLFARAFASVREVNRAASAAAAAANATVLFFLPFIFIRIGEIMIINDEHLHKRNDSFAYLNETGIGYAEFNVKNK